MDPKAMLEAQRPLIEARREGFQLDNELKREELTRAQRNRMAKNKIGGGGISASQGGYKGPGNSSGSAMSAPVGITPRFDPAKSGTVPTAAPTLAERVTPDGLGGRVAPLSVLAKSRTLGTSPVGRVLTGTEAAEASAMMIKSDPAYAANKVRESQRAVDAAVSDAAGMNTAAVDPRYQGARMQTPRTAFVQPTTSTLPNQRIQPRMRPANTAASSAVRNPILAAR